MTLLDAIQAGLERRATATTGLSLKMPGGKVLRLFGAEETEAGIRVDEEDALSWSALGSAVQIVAETVATLPVKVFEERSGGGKDRVRSHPVGHLLRVAPNPEQTPVEFFESYVSNIMLWGNGYAEKQREGSDLTSLWPLNPDRVRSKRRSNGQLVYEVTLPDDEQDRRGTRRRVVILFDDEVLHTRGFTTRGLLGSSLAERYKNAIGLGLATEKYVARFFRNSALPGGAIEVEGELSDEAHQRMKDDWRQIHQGMDNAHRVAILEEGSKWQQITTDPEKAQALGLRQFQLGEATRMTRVPQHMLGNLERATFSNIEQQSLEFVIHTIRPWLRRLEARMQVDLFTRVERERGLFAEFSVEGLLRGDSQARSQFYQVMLNNGLMSPNEIREKENLNPYEGGDRRFLQVNMMPVDQMGQMGPAERMRLLAAGVSEASQEEHRHLPPPAGESRAAQTRLRLVNSFRPVYRQAMDRIVSEEDRNLRRAADELLDGDDTSDFREFLRDYYFGNDDRLTGEADVGEGHPEIALRQIRVALQAHAPEVAEAAAREVGESLEEGEREVFVAEYGEKFARRYSASSRRKLQKVVQRAEDTDGEDPREALDDQLDTWREGAEGVRPKAERWADRESRRFDNALSKTAFAAAGVAAFVWASTGDSCPFCSEMDGRRVSIGTLFLEAGTEFQPEGAEAPLRPRNSIGHPPLHDGCDCLILPGL